MHRFKTIAVLGVDGSGKSTVISEMAAVLAANKYKVDVKHLRPHVLPPLAVLKKWKLNEKSGTVDYRTPHSAPSSGLIFSLIRLIYLGIDYFFSYFPYGLDRKKVRIYDRYFYDLYVDSKRFRIDLSSSLLWKFIQFFKTPDIVIILTGNPEDIYNRKPELSVSEIGVQQVKLKEVAEQISATIIDTSQPFPQTLKQVRMILERYE